MGTTPPLGVVESTHLLVTTVGASPLRPPNNYQIAIIRLQHFLTVRKNKNVIMTIGDKRFMAEKDRFRKREIRVKLSEEEYATILAKTAEAEMTISDAIRSLIVFGNIKAEWLDEESKRRVDELCQLIEKVIYEVNRIGNNINQIAYNTNLKYKASENELKEAYVQLGYAARAFLDGIDEMRELINANNTYT